MAGQPGFFDRGERLKALSAACDPLDSLAQVINFRGIRAGETGVRSSGIRLRAAL